MFCLPRENNHHKIWQNCALVYKAFQCCTKCFLLFFLLLWSGFYSFFYFTKYRFKFYLIIFASARLISPSFILSMRALSNLLNFASAVWPLYLYYLYIKSSFVYKFIKYLFLLLDQWTIFITISIFFDSYNFSLVLNCFYLSFSLVFSGFYLFFKSFEKRRIS